MLSLTGQNAGNILLPRRGMYRQHGFALLPAGGGERGAENIDGLKEWFRHLGLPKEKRGHY